MEQEKMLWKLDLGCGNNCYQENGVKYTGVDKYNLPGVDIVHDLTQFPYPFEDESVTHIFSSHFIEHLDGEQRIKFFEELYRIMVPGAKAKFVHPYYKSVRAIQDPTHRWPPIAEESYLYWNKKWRSENKIEHYLTNADVNFSLPAVNYTFSEPIWHLKSDEAKIFAMKHYFNVVADMMVELTKLDKNEI